MYIHARREKMNQVRTSTGRGYSAVEYHLHIRLNHVFQVFPHMQISEELFTGVEKKKERDSALDFYLRRAEKFTSNT